MRDSARLKGRYEGAGARTYEADRRHESKWAREDAVVRAMLGTVAPASLVDVPVGTGRFMPAYHDLGVDCVGVDLSRDMLDVSRAAFPDAIVLQGDVARLAFPDSTFDVGLCIRFCNLVDYTVVEAAVRELARVSRRHVILGVRTRRSLRELVRDGAWRAGLAAARRARTALAGLVRVRKMKPHPEAAVLRLFTLLRLEIVRREVVEVGGDGSRYDIFLLARR